ncbi:alpha/beta hydrolase fold domain-containing protein [Asticcacaulis sp. BYS171W]|uniref:Alpha/beta hydrolase fold domain-containing protein n=1 Tax=Asticcacaulis aquaticus TaxID=2984212 RepID=A0ABT5HV59_9CAUL|nr:alpha/beta hydrolase fold domain-containing protein [Asticcacaulis aquaticus]MDC7683943.1 alpha/beta hydrolase fold domain-containing protein [Asticcacaulis aquaticus]
MPLPSLKQPLPRQSVLRRWGLRGLLSLPFSVLKFLSGGGVVHVQGRTLDTQITFLWKTFFARQDHRTPLSLTGTSVEGAREDWQEAATLMGDTSALKVRVETVGDGGLIGGRLIRPAQVSANAPLLVFFHDGNGVLGGPDLSLAFAAGLAAEARCPVFLPEYRLAPEHRFPAGYDDARAAWDWAATSLTKLGATSDQIAVGGAGIGANMAARLCLDLRRDFKPLPAAQLLVSPLLDLSDAGLRTSPYAKSWPVSAADIDIAIGHYAGAGIDLSDPAISPLREGLVSGQPRTLVVSGGLDPLADQAERYVKRLLEARTRVVYRRYDTLPLGFGLFAGVSDHAAEATRDIARLWSDLTTEIGVEE